MELIPVLNNLGDEVLANAPMINHGGCCVFASSVVENLRSIGIIANGIVAGWNGLDEKPLTEIRKKLPVNPKFEDWSNNGVSFHHVGVEFSLKGKLYHYDTFGVHRKDKELDGMPIYRGRLMPEELKVLASRADGWNSTFPRSQIPMVRRIVKKHFKNVTVVA